MQDKRPEISLKIAESELIVPNLEHFSLDALASFDAIALHGGLGPAARAIGRPKTTLSRHLAELEEAVGVRLVERGERRIRLTEEGRRLHERAHEPLLDLFDAARNAASGLDRPRGVLRVSAPMVLAHTSLLPVAMRFCADYPDVTLDLIAEDRRVDPVEDGYDIVIRIDPRPDERLVGRRIATDRRLVVADPHIPVPAAGESDVVGVMMAVATASARWQIRDDAGRCFTLLPRARLRMSSLLMVREAVLQGLGIGLLPELLVAADIAAGRLVLWGEIEGPVVEIWALHSSRRLPSAKVRAFLDTLAQAAPFGRGRSAPVVKSG